MVGIIVAGIVGIVVGIIVAGMVDIEVDEAVAELVALGWPPVVVAVVGGTGAPPFTGVVEDVTAGASTGAPPLDGWVPAALGVLIGVGSVCSPNQTEA